MHLEDVLEARNTETNFIVAQTRTHLVTLFRVQVLHNSICEEKKKKKKKEYIFIYITQTIIENRSKTKRSTNFTLPNNQSILRVLFSSQVA